MEQQALQIVVISSVVILAMVLLIFITLFTLFQKKKVEFIMREKEQEKIFEETLTNSQIEIRENALQNIAWELHDNVGQMLSLSRLELNVLQNSCKLSNNKSKIKEVSQLIGDSLSEIRSLSKTLNPEVINNMGFIQSIQNDINRFNKLQFIKAKLNIHGEEYEIPQKDVIILFRIMQEFLSNTVKHAQATELIVDLNYTTEYLKILVTDNGKGFNVETVEKGSGLINMKSRAALINTTLLLESDTDGTRIQLQYKNRKDEK